MRVEVDIDDEQCECITVQELKLAIELNMSPTEYQGECPNEPDWELLEALKIVLNYFSTPSDKDYFARMDLAVKALKKEFAQIN
jgi:hypothetical protein